jgi:LemA protein
MNIQAKSDDIPETKVYNMHIKYLYILGLAFYLSGCGINNIPAYDEEVTASWSQVLNQYKRRADLVPNLVDTVKAYAEHESSVFIEVTKARSRVLDLQLPEDITSNKDALNDFQNNQKQLGDALSRLLLVVEQYPDLKSNRNYIALQSQLEGTENRIAIARRDYIKAVQQYNTELRTYPGKIWKSVLYSEARLRENFTTSDTVDNVPVVNLKQ